jgi:hypothetical protein
VATIEGECPFVWRALCCANFECAFGCLRFGVDLEVTHESNGGTTPLLVCCRPEYVQPSTVQLLLDFGADPNAGLLADFRQCPAGTTSLRSVVHHSNPYTDDEMTARVEAAKKLLLKAGAGKHGNTRAAFLAGMARDNALKIIDLTDLDMTELPEELRECTEVEVLRLKGNCLERVPGWVWELRKLRILDLSQNDLKELPHAAKAATQLEQLDLTSNPGLVNLCVELVHLDKLTTLKLPQDGEDNEYCLSMKNPPQEVCNRGLDNIKGFLRDTLDGTVANMQVKVLLLGLGEAGKTSFVNAIVEKRSRLMAKEARTVGIEQRVLQVPTAMGQAQLLIYVSGSKHKSVYRSRLDSFLFFFALHLHLHLLATGLCWAEGLLHHTPSLPDGAGAVHARVRSPQVRVHRRVLPAAGDGLGALDSGEMPWGEADACGHEMRPDRERGGGEGAVCACGALVAGGGGDGREPAQVLPEGAA